MSTCKDAEILTKEYISKVHQCVGSFTLLRKAWEAYWLFRKECKKAQSPMEQGVKKYIRRLDTLLQSPELDDPDKYQVKNILDMLYSDAKSNARTYVEKDK